VVRDRSPTRPRDEPPQAADVRPSWNNKEVSNGGIGPGYGSLPLTGPDSIATMYASFRSGSWPDSLVPVWDWGDAVWSCVDREGRVVTHDDVIAGLQPHGAT